MEANDESTWAAGRCACGDVSYALSSPPLVVHACHCTDCQRLSGASFVVNLWLERDRLRITTGELSSVKLPSGSPAGQLVHFCARCGTHIYTRYLAAPGDTAFVRGGTLDDPSVAPPNVHIYTRSRRPWTELPSDVPVFDGYYDARDVWPPDRLARYRENRARQRSRE